ncbi:MAG: ferrochelatase [Sphingobacteriales bacterium]|nr:MAG: ferrochelatase [Sphingobacteriales bacterium]
MAHPKIGVLLVNTGTPDSPQTPDVRKYLREFLMDKRVIDIPYPQRFALINGIIAPFRAPKSAVIYKQLWTDNGSPLIIHAEAVTKLLQESLGPDYYVAYAMRYQSPGMDEVVAKLKEKLLEKIVVIPLFPQYASASTGSVHDKVMEIVKDWQVIPDMKMVSTFCNHPTFIKAWADVAKPYLEQQNWDHFVFSYHGLPERQILKASAKDYCQLNNKCCSSYHRLNRFCYRAQCFETSRQMAAIMGIAEKDYTVAFQSRLGKDP